MLVQRLTCLSKIRTILGFMHGKSRARSICPDHLLTADLVWPISREAWRREGICEQTYCQNVCNGCCCVPIYSDLLPRGACAECSGNTSWREGSNLLYRGAGDRLELRAVQHGPDDRQVFRRRD